MRVSSVASVSHFLTDLHILAAIDLQSAAPGGKMMHYSNQTSDSQIADILY